LDFIVRWVVLTAGGYSSTQTSQTSVYSFFPKQVKPGERLNVLPLPNTNVYARNMVQLAPHGAASPPAAASAGLEASIGLITLNSRYIHLALSLRCLRNAAREAGFRNVWLAEYTIHAPLWKLAAEVSARRPAVLGFSVYIWNREPTLALIERLKQQDPSLVIVVGGPEVSFETVRPPFVDVVIAGEGEEKWAEFLRGWAKGERPDDATLTRWATQGNSEPPLVAPPYLPEDQTPEAALHTRLVYLETSRGCPYSCSFCLSALEERVRFYPDASVRQTLTSLMAAGARRIKFLDRTFNLNRKRMREWITWLMGFPGMQFHFEVVADLLDEETLALLDTVPPGMFQFEVGIQSTAPATQTRIARRQGTRLFPVIQRLIRAGRVHLHLDLIWGLPGETLREIRQGFEEVMALRPHELQLGFLKFLPGAPIRKDIIPYEYRYESRPPYEVISHRELPSAELLFLKRFAEVFDLYHNSGHFRFTMERLMAVMGAWELFTALAGHFEARALLVPAHSMEVLAKELLAWAQGTEVVKTLSPEELEDLVRLDFCYHHRVRRLPGFLSGPRLPEPPEARLRRKGDPSCIVLPFRHRLTLAEGRARLEPVSTPIWYALIYPEDGEGYFFRPRLEPLA